MSGGRSAAAVLAGAALLAGSIACADSAVDSDSGRRGGERMELAPVPHPDLSATSEELRAQIDELRGVVESDGATRDAETLGQAWGDLARAYHAYGFADAAAAAYRNAAALQPEIAAWPYLAGLLERRRGGHQAAVAHFRRVLELDPDSAVARLHLGETLLDLGQLDAAVAELEEAATSKSLAAAALAALGRAARDQGEPARALELYARALAAQPEADLLYHSIAAAHRSLGDEQRAVEALARAGQTPPRFPDPAAASLEELATTSGALLLRGSRALVSERPQEAVEHYRRAVEAAPEDAEARRNLALALRATGDLDGALAELEHAARLAPQSHLVAFDLGNLQMARGAQEAAAAAFASSIAIAPEFVPARFNLANTQLMLGRADEALAHLERVLELEPGHARAGYQAAMAKARLGRVDEARGDLERLLEKDPGSAPALLGLAELRAQAGDLAGARAAYEEVATRGGEAGYRVDARIGLAGLDRREGRLQTEIENLRAAADLAPDREDLREELARRLESTGRFAEAASERQVLVELRPEVVMNRLLEATDWVQAGRSDLARERLEQAVERMPDEKLLANSLARLLATAREPEVRDGWRALEIAQGLYTRHPGPDVTETLAMAHAEVGQFAEAIEVQSALIDQVRRAGQTGHLPRLEENLRRFERREAIRM